MHSDDSPVKMEGDGLWMKLMNIHVGPLPLPVYVGLAAIIIFAIVGHHLPNDLIGGFALMLLAGFLLGDIGANIPVLKHIGGSAILAIFVPSILVGYKLLDADTLNVLTTTMKKANLLYLYIACLVCGSILGMSQKVLVEGFMRMFVPIMVGTIAAVVAGVGAGLLFGFDPKHTFFYIVIPIVSGGIGEGILPLSMAYSEILATPQPELIASLIPAALIGNVVAILSSGYLKWLGERRPELSGNGNLVRTNEDQTLLDKQHEVPLDLGLMGAGLTIACSLFILGHVLAPITGIPGPILMIICAAIFKVAHVMPAAMELGAYQMYKFMAKNLTFVIMVGLGALYVPWNQMVAALSVGYFVVCMAVVLAMVASGFFIGFVMKMYPIESAIVTACHSGLGGTGDVAILTAANRMELMPFAQTATRLGGAGMVVLATILLKIFH